VPLGLVLVGGPLIDAGFEVKLIDADARKLSSEELTKEVRDFNPDLIGVSHTGSTAAHSHIVSNIELLKNNLPKVPIVYGGIYPSFAWRAIMEDMPEVDYIVRGEGEQILLDLASALRDGSSLADIDGLVWRDSNGMRVNKGAKPICNLDQYRPAWELVDWDLYKLMGRRAAGLQFGRGCPHSCGFCGQWIFWRRYRHRSPKNFVDQIEYLVKEEGIEHFWPADEHFGADREALIEVLQDIVDRGLKITLTLNISVDAILRDEDILDLYKKAGMGFLSLGVESDNDEIVEGFEKSSYEKACRAMKLLRQHGILTCANVIFGLEDETYRTLWRRLWRLRRMNPDFLNATYLTPHFWTPIGSKVPLDKVIQPDSSRWGYRNQVLVTENMSAMQLFLAVKVTEFFIHVRPKRVWEALFPYDRGMRNLGIWLLWRALIVWVIEIFRDRPKGLIEKGDFEADPSAVRVLFPRAIRKQAD
jgi:anaerobic magnesium-protoporphyrin IX monomethyl ester cyclase